MSKAAKERAAPPGAVGTTKPTRRIPKPKAFMEMDDVSMVIVSNEDWDYIVDTLSDYFDYLDVQEMKADPATELIPWEETRKRLLENNIKKVRRRKKISQKELAERLRVSQARVSQIEDPDYRPTRKTYERVARAMSCPIEALVR